MNSQSKADDKRADSGKKPLTKNSEAKAYKSILVCYDGSDNAKRALERAIEITKEIGSELSIIVAADTFNIQARYLERYYRDLRKVLLHDAKVQLSKASETAKTGGIASVQGSVEEGHPADMILAKAFEVNADLIVVGRRGVRGIQKYLLGSVSSSVVGNSTCDVLVVK